MHFPTALAAATLAAFAIAAPTTTTMHKRAVFSAQAYNDISISGGTAGKAQAEALAKLGGLPKDLTTVQKADLDFLNSVNQVANDAETEAFNTAIDAASGNAKQALQNGKIKNKVLKLQATVLKLQAQQAQGQDVADKLATESKKLATNIATDKQHAGEASTAVDFDGEVST